MSIAHEDLKVRAGTGERRNSFGESARSIVDLSLPEGDEFDLDGHGCLLR
jgi:hypothetical protein